MFSPGVEANAIDDDTVLGGVEFYSELEHSCVVTMITMVNIGVSKFKVSDLQQALGVETEEPEVRGNRL